MSMQPSAPTIPSSTPASAALLARGKNSGPLPQAQPLVSRLRAAPIPRAVSAAEEAEWDSLIDALDDTLGP